MSTASAFSGDTYTTCGPAARAAPGSWRLAWWARYMRSMQTRNAARVFPDPVGAAISVCRPAAISGQPPAWGSVGPAGNRPSNQRRTAG